MHNSSLLTIHQWLNDSLVPYIENDVVANINSDVIIQRFQSMKTR
jgi:hypothetical protein